MVYATISRHALKGQKLLAQGSALGNSCCSSAPCKGKSIKIYSGCREAFALTGRNYHLYIIPRALPWARSFCPFRAYGANPLNRAYGAPLNRAYGAPLNRAYGAPLNRAYGFIL